MDLFADTLLALLCFGIVLGSGAWAFRSYVGGTSQAVAVPMLLLPLLSDWIRFLAGIPFTLSFAVAGAIYLGVAGFFGFKSVRAEKRLFDSKWWLALVVVLATQVVIRIWLVTERGPNPGDDTYAGFKTQALLHSQGWPTIHPEAPDLPISYYYHAYMWPAALAPLGISIKAGWWVTAIILCVVGGMLVLELIMASLKNRGDVALASVTVAVGCSLSVVLALVQRLPPRLWLQEAGYLTQEFGLYMRVPVTVGAYWAPFNAIATGVLLVATIFLLDSIRGRWSLPRFLWTVLVVGSLAGYCTFHLIGFMLIVVPVLTVVAWRETTAGTLRRWLTSLVALGTASALATLPLLLDLAQRQTATRYDRFRDPLHIWLQTAFEKFSVLQVLGLGFWILAAALLSNILLLPLLARWRAGRLDFEAKSLLAVFGVGTLVSFFGVTDDFVPKFGLYIASLPAVVFLRSGPWRGWERALWIAGLTAPLFLALNAFRANLATPKWDRVWHLIDQTATKTGEVVLYDVPFSERRNRNPWQNVIPYFSRARFLVPADQVDDQGQNFLRDPAALATLPSTERRLAQMIGDAPTYLLLTTPDRPPAGEELYRSGLFSLQRIQHNATIASPP